jgi:hypothetical protein
MVANNKYLKQRTNDDLDLKLVSRTTSFSLQHRGTTSQLFNTHISPTSPLLPVPHIGINIPVSAKTLDSLARERETMRTWGERLGKKRRVLKKIKTIEILKVDRDCN